MTSPQTSSQSPVELDALVARLQRGETVSMAVRAVLSWFGESRRSAAALRRVDAALSARGIAVRPAIADAWIDEPVAFSLVQAVTEEAPPAPPAITPVRVPEHVERSSNPPPQVAPVVAAPPAPPADPVNRIGAISAAHRKLVSIRPDAPLSEALSVLRLYGVYCVTVTSHDDRRQFGVVTWRALAKALSVAPGTEPVRGFTEPAREFGLEADVFEVARTVRTEGPVLVRHHDNRFFGPISHEDLLDEFGTRLEPFLLVGEVESELRSIVESHLPAEIDALRVARPSSANGLTLGECQALLQRDENFRKTNLDFSRALFNQRLDEVREIRNELMHFNRGDAVGPSETATLRVFVRALRENVRKRS